MASNTLQKTQEQKISPIQRAQLFGQATRQHWQALPAIPGGNNQVVSFALPKTRLCSRIMLEITANINAVHATDVTYTLAPFAPFSYVRNVRVESNLGFTFINLSGRDLFFYNLLTNNSVPLNVVAPATAALASASRARNVQGLQSASGGGANNPCRFILDLPISLNKRDAIGLLMLQNPESTVTVSVEFGTPVHLGTGPSVLTISNVQVTPLVETFSIPAIPQAFPDISILKSIRSGVESIAGAGVTTVKLPVGQTYRKLLWFIADAAGVGVADSAISGNFEVVINQADTPYRIKPAVLTAINTEEYGQPLPVGLWALDFSSQGLANLGGARDYIDTERLTEFWLRFNAASAGNVTCIYETLASLV